MPVNQHFKQLSKKLKKISFSFTFTSVDINASETRKLISPVKLKEGLRMNLIEIWGYFFLLQTLIFLVQKL